jgi:GNAT superfamily N-acetyltransferase
MNFGLLAVRPEYQGRGVPAIMMTEITRAGLANGITNAETGRQLEDNKRVRSLWNSFSTRQHKRRRVYLKELA